MNLNLPQTNLDDAVDGRWCDFNDTIRFKIAMSNNPKHKRAIQNKLKQIEKLRDKGDYSRVEIINNEILAQHILKDWEGLKDDGKALPFSQQAALSILNDPRYSPIREFIVDESMEFAEYEDEAEETVKK